MARWIVGLEFETPEAACEVAGNITMFGHAPRIIRLRDRAGQPSNETLRAKVNELETELLSLVVRVSDLENADPTQLVPGMPVGVPHTPDGELGDLLAMAKPAAESTCARWNDPQAGDWFARFGGITTRYEVLSVTDDRIRFRSFMSPTTHPSVEVTTPLAWRANGGRLDPGSEIVLMTAEEVDAFKSEVRAIADAQERNGVLLADAVTFREEKVEKDRLAALRVRAACGCLFADCADHGAFGYATEAERLEAERLEAERLEAERLEAERLEAMAMAKPAEKAEPTDEELNRVYNDAPDYLPALRALYNLGREHAAASQEGHGHPCYYCGGKCNSAAGDPGRWPIALCHADEPGVVKWHHTECVSRRLKERDALLARAEKAIAGERSASELLGAINAAMSPFEGLPGEPLAKSVAALVADRQKRGEEIAAVEAAIMNWRPAVKSLAERVTGLLASNDGRGVEIARLHGEIRAMRAAKGATTTEPASQALREAGEQ